MQLFVRTNRTCTINVQPGESVADLKLHVQARTGVPAGVQRLQCGARVLPDDATLCSLPFLEPGATLQLLLRLRGGKGGFGALLRGAGRAALTDNFDACRDLSGRRMRHVNAELKMAEWAEEARERELEKVALKHVKDQERELRRTEQNKVDMASVAQQRESALSDLQDAVAAALHKGKRPAGAEPSVPGGAARKRPRGRQMSALDDLSSSDEDSDGEGIEEAVPAHSTRAAGAGAGPSGSGGVEPDSGASTVAEPAVPSIVEPALPAAVPVEPAAAAPAAPVVEPEEPVAVAVVGPAAAPEFGDGPVELARFGSVEELEAAVGGVRLKAELQRLGLKCGGTAAQRAARLWLLRDTPLDKLDRKLFAKGGK